MLYISLAMHGILLFVPVPSEETTATSKDKTVKITQLSNVSTKPAANSSLTPSSKPVETPKAVETPKPQKVTTANPRLVIPPSPRPAATPPSQLVQPVSPKPTPKPSLQPSLTPSAQATPSPTLTSAAEATPSPTPTPVTEAAAANPNDLFADFPHFQPSNPGCFNLPSCYETKQVLNTVTKHFDDVLKTKYPVKSRNSDPKGTVYEFSKAGITKFLSLIHVDQQQGTVYVIADEPIDLAKLKGAVQTPVEFDIVADDLDTQTADEYKFADTGLFFTSIGQLDAEGNQLPPTPRPGLTGIPKFVDQQTPDQVYAALEPKLKSSFEQVTPGDAYGGGNVYELKKGDFTGYLNLVPAKDSAGTIVVLWTNKPQ